MDSMFEDDISILTQEGLGPDEDWLDSPNTDLSGEMCSASHFALITAYDDIKNRLTGLERENSTLKRRLKVYEVKYPLIGEFGEDHIFSLYEARETSLLKSEKASLQQQLNQFQHELQKSKEREEQLEEMIQAYEKLCVEKADLETELAEMRALVETHLSRIRSLEQQLRQRDGGSFPLPGQEVPFLTLHPNPSLTHVLERAGGWQSRGLEAELEVARQESQRAQHREEHLKAECERLQAELKHLQDSREQDQSERDMAWVKKVGDDHPVPELPGKSSFFVGSTDEFIEKRRQGLQQFLEKVVQNVVLLSDSRLHLFLQSQLSLPQIETCVQGQGPQSVTEAILHYAMSNAGWGQEEDTPPRLLAAGDRAER
ncbi:sorting nexin-11 [Phaethornis superciliosus]